MTQEQLDAIGAMSHEVGRLSEKLQDLQSTQQNQTTALELIHSTLGRINDNLSDLRISHANARGEQQRALEEILPAMRALRADVEQLRKRLDPEPEGETTVVELRDVSSRR